MSCQNIKNWFKVSLLILRYKTHPFNPLGRFLILGYDEPEFFSEDSLCFLSAILGSYLGNCFHSEFRDIGTSATKNNFLFLSNKAGCLIKTKVIIRQVLIKYLYCYHKLSRT